MNLPPCRSTHKLLNHSRLVYRLDQMGRHGVATPPGLGLRQVLFEGMASCYICRTWLDSAMMVARRQDATLIGLVDVYCRTSRLCARYLRIQRRFGSVNAFFGDLLVRAV